MLRTSPALALAALWISAGCDSGPGAADAGADAGPRTQVVKLNLDAMPNPMGVIDIGDPHAMKVGDTWYLYATTSTLVIEGWKSKDLSSWTSLGAVWRPTAGTWTEPAEAWAPSVHPADGGGYYLYYVSYRRIGVAYADTPEGPFMDMLDHPLVGSGNGGVGDGIYQNGATLPNNIADYDDLAIDPFLLQLPDGSKYLYFVHYLPVSVISVLEMDDYIHPHDTTPTDVVMPDQRWETPVVEGPWVARHGANLALMFSGNFVLTSKYAIGYAMGTDPKGPFTQWADNPWLRTDSAPGISGPGHHAVNVDAQGAPLAFFHADQPDDTRRVYTGTMSFGTAGQPVLGR